MAVSLCPTHFPTVKTRVPGKTLSPASYTILGQVKSSEDRTLPTALGLPSLLNRDVVSFSHKMSKALYKLSGKVPSTVLMEQKEP